MKRLIYGNKCRTSEASIPADGDATPTQGEPFTALRVISCLAHSITPDSVFPCTRPQIVVTPAEELPFVFGPGPSTLDSTISENRGSDTNSSVQVHFSGFRFGAAPAPTSSNTSLSARRKIGRPALHIDVLPPPQIHSTNRAIPAKGTMQPPPNPPTSYFSVHTGLAPSNDASRIPVTPIDQIIHTPDMPPELPRRATCKSMFQTASEQDHSPDILTPLSPCDLQACYFVSSPVSSDSRAPALLHPRTTNYPSKPSLSLGSPYGHFLSSPLESSYFASQPQPPSATRLPRKGMNLPKLILQRKNSAMSTPPLSPSCYLTGQTTSSPGTVRSFEDAVVRAFTDLQLASPPIIRPLGKRSRSDSSAVCPSVDQVGV